MEFSPASPIPHSDVHINDQRTLVNVVIKDLKIRNLQRTKPDIVEKIVSHSVMTLRELEEAQAQVIQDLSALKIFSELKIDVAKSPQEKKKLFSVDLDLTISLTEQKMKSLAINVNTHIGEYPMVSVKGGFKNLFGRCETLQLSVSTEPHVTSIDVLKNFGVNLAFEKPFLLWDKPGQKMSVNLDRYKVDHTYTSSYSESGVTLGAQFDQAGEPGSHTNRRWSYELSQRSIKCDSTANEKVLLEGGPNVKSAIGHTWNYDSLRDSYYNGEGTYVNLSTEIAGLGGDVSHFKQTSNFSTIFPLVSDVSLSLSLKTGLHVPLLSKSFISDRYFLGGLNNFRGFYDKGLGPRALSRIEHKDIEGNFLGGDMFYVSSIDLSVPIANPKEMGEVKLHLFSHFGTIDSFKESDTSLEKLKHYCSSMTDLSKSRLSVGAGFAYKFVPVGKFEINFNVPLKFQPGDSRASGIQIGVSDLFS